MIIKELKNHFPARAIEWFVSAILASWGSGVLLQPGLFQQNAVFHGMSTIATQEFWGLGAFSVGIIRCVALFINGTWQRTPAIRVITSFMSSFVWTQITLGLVLSHQPNLGWCLFPWFILADFYSVFNAAADMKSAVIIQEISKGV